VLLTSVGFVFFPSHLLLHRCGRGRKKEGKMSAAQEQKKKEERRERGEEREEREFTKESKNTQQHKISSSVTLCSRRHYLLEKK